MVEDRVLDVTLRGEIVAESAGDVRDQVRREIARLRPMVVRIDLGGVTLLDSSGVAMLVNVFRAAATVQAKCVIQNPSARVYRVLDLVGVLETFGVAPRQ
jgi:anti-sigma B factor antagonist